MAWHCKICQLIFYYKPLPVQHLFTQHRFFADPPYVVISQPTEHFSQFSDLHSNHIGVIGSLQPLLYTSTLQIVACPGPGICAVLLHHLSISEHHLCLCYVSSKILMAKNILGNHELL